MNFLYALEKQISLCYHRRMKKKAYRLTHKNPVSEQEFLAHLYKTCDDKYLRSMILSYYKKQKMLDHKYGKKLSISAYGIVPFFGPYGNSLTDQAKHLFGAKVSQKLLVEFVETFGDKACEVIDKTIRSKPLKTQIIRARNAFLQSFLKSNSNITIGKAELFRWQFVNFIKHIEADDKEILRGTGTINIIKRNITIHNLVPLKLIGQPDRTIEKHYIDKTTIYHELTHLMSVKTFANGFYNYITEHEFQDQKTLLTALPVFLEGTPNKPKALNLFSKGLTMLIELATERFTSACISNTNSAKNIAFYENFQNSADVQCVHFKAIKDKNYVVHSEYHFFGHLLELILVLNGLDNSDVLSPASVPTQNIIETVEKFFESGKLSPNLALIIDTKVSKKFGVEINKVKSANNYFKFVLLLGMAYQTFEASLMDSRYLETTKNFNSAYDKNAMLLQAMILDIHKNKFDKTFENLQNDPQKRKKFLEAYAQIAGFADGWVIKPNIKIKKKEECFFLREKSSTLNLATLSKGNIALDVWSSFLKDIIAKTQKFAPQIFEKNNFLNREKNYLINQKNNLEK